MIVYYLVYTAQCPVLQSPTDGIVMTTSNRLSGSTATYTCNSGFELLDLTPESDVRTCQSDGTWSGSEPQCIGIYFNTLIEPATI